MKNKLPGIIAISALAAVAVTAAFVFLTPKYAAGKNVPGGKNGMRKGPAPGQTVLTVKTQVMKTDTLHDYIMGNGEVESQNSVSVFPDKSGKIISTSVMLGSKVKRGDIIAYIDPSQPGETYRQSPVYAPISGSIISTPLRNGTTVSTNTEIAIIGDIGNLQVTANIPERYVAVLKTGLKGFISVEAYPDVTFDVTVSRVSPVVDSTSRTKQIVLTFDKKDQRVNAGMFAKVKLYTQDYGGTVTMPLDSLVTKNDSYFAYVVKNDSTVEKREVLTGKKVDGTVQITEGLKDGDIVVIQGQTSLSDGAKIKDISGNVPEGGR